MLNNLSFAVIKTKRYCPLTGSVFPRNVLKLISRVPSLVTKSQRDKHSFFPLNYFYWDLNQNCLLPGHSRSGRLNSWPFFSLKQDAILQPEVAKGLWKTNGATDPELHEPRAVAAQVESHHPYPFTAGLHSQSAS